MQAFLGPSGVQERTGSSMRGAGGSVLEPRGPAEAFHPRCSSGKMHPHQRGEAAGRLRGGDRFGGKIARVSFPTVRGRCFMDNHAIM